MLDRFQAVRAFSETLAETLATEDYVVQTMPDVSPTKWHLAHTTWFFETFVVKPSIPDYTSPDPQFEVLFNSYYNAVGRQWTRSQRGLLARPTVAQVYDYRKRVDEAVAAIVDSGTSTELQGVLEIGLHHEQQHQELLLTDIKHVFAFNPLRPTFRDGAAVRSPQAPGDIGWRRFAGGVRSFGFDGDGFCYDNELPHHEALVQDFRIADRLVTNGEWLEFMADGGYSTASLWLSEGWSRVQEEGWQAPLYWEEVGDRWSATTLGGFREIDPNEPVTHVSLFEADAFASWAGARLPTEFEWEMASADADAPRADGFVDSLNCHPRSRDCDQFFGDVWEWTRSAYSPYPGYRPAEGALGEYNGKFMSNQTVLRGGSCATSLSHIRPTYRNFFPAHSRWQFSGLRLARDA